MRKKIKNILFSNFNMSVKYKDVKLEEICLSKPEKLEKVHFSEILLNKNKLSVQTPADMYYKDNNISFSLVKKGEFYTFIENIKSRVVEILFNNSENFFKGKKFSQEYIYNSVEDVISITENGNAIINEVEQDADCQVYDYFKELVENPELPYKGTFILEFSGIKFVKKSIKISVNITAVKLSAPRLNYDDNTLNYLEPEGENSELQTVSHTSSQQIDKLVESVQQTVLDDEQEFFS